ncbi:putative ABC transport system permease protein [Arsukibacterium tuosuense]|uniref:Putative ABC transport system permease protein n=1 Tax=Arsukibacterium tuosuense TaxID=1323745 RepID=A0A285ISD6_9GAMM|nr:FtsX-like permease family protein [Arsukibacterium tuosuense]SNY50884.1 putative ABC transport system permease protein [Arsukibacterium tuosuense]
MSLTLLFKSLLQRKVITILLLIQLMLTLALVSNSILLSQQAYTLSNQPTGLQLETTLAIELKPTDENLIVHPALGELIQRQLAELRKINGVRYAAFTNQTPLMFGGMNGDVFVPDHAETSSVDAVPYNYAEAGLFDALQMTLLHGRWLSAEDKNTDNVVLTEKLANRLFGQSHLALGQQISAGTVVGVVADMMYQRFASDQYYGLFFNRDLSRADYGYRLILQVESQAVAAVRQQINQSLRQVEPEIDIQHIVSLRQLHRDVFEQERGLAILLSVLSALMLLVAMISAYSHALFHGVQQQNEIGIKRALGASKRRILLEVLSESWLTTGIGVTLGLLASFLLQQQLATVISLPALPLWLPFAGALMLLFCVTAATWYPAAIATRVSPATATKAL